MSHNHSFKHLSFLSIPARLALTLALGLGMILSLLLLLSVEPALADGDTYYVNAATGDDSRTAVQAQNPATPWKTIGHGVANVPAASTPANPDTISVAAGTYDVSNNGEVFPIVMNNANVKLVGAGAGTTIIDGENPENINLLEINASGVTVEGFTIQNAGNYDAIRATTGGITLTHNAIYTAGSGIDLYVHVTLSGGSALHRGRGGHHQQYGCEPIRH